MQRRWIQLAVVSTFCVLAASCAADDDTDPTVTTSESSTTSTAPSTTASTATTSTTPITEVGDLTTVSAEALGPIMFGSSTLGDVEDLFALDIVQEDDVEAQRASWEGAAPGYCLYLPLPGAVEGEGQVWLSMQSSSGEWPDDARAMIVDGVWFDGGDLQTASGLGIGSTLDDVRAALGDDMEEFQTLGGQPGIRSPVLGDTHEGFAMSFSGDPVASIAAGGVATALAGEGCA